MQDFGIYCQNAERLEAQGFVLASDRRVLLKFPSGDRFASQVTTHALLEEMVAGVVPETCRAVINDGGPLSFPFRSKNEAYQIQVCRDQEGWSLEATRASEVDNSSGVKAESLSAVNESMEAGVAPEASESVSVSEDIKTATASVSAQVSSTVGWMDGMMRKMMEVGFSDLHLSSGAVPYWRLDGEMCALESEGRLDSGFLEQQIRSISPNQNAEEFDRRNDTDFAYEIPGLSRFRVNVFRDRKGVGAVMRTIPFSIPSADDLGLPPAILELGNLSKGLVLVTGPTGSGKSTTLAALIDHINQTRKDHLITIEDPIEFVHANKKCLVNQREIGRHTDGFKDALRAALREDPDIVLVGEMRDLETIEIAVETAETGHLVFGTLHTSTAPSTVDRIIDQFPTDRQEQIRQMLSSSLKGVISQVLCKKRGGGRIAAHEVLIGTSAVSNLIREAKTFQLFSLMQTGKTLGMSKMEDSLMQLVSDGHVDPDEAYRKCNDKQAFRTLLERAGVRLGGPGCSEAA